MAQIDYPMQIITKTEKPGMLGYKELKWYRTNFYCMNCGKQTIVQCSKIWEDNAGYQHLCYSCGYGVMHPGNSYYNKEYFTEIVKQIRETIKEE